MIIIPKAQGRALAKLCDHAKAHPERPAASPDMLKEGLPTLNALVDMGYAAQQLTLGVVGHPRTCTYYQITQEGIRDLPHIDYVK